MLGTQDAIFNRQPLPQIAFRQRVVPLLHGQLSQRGQQDALVLAMPCLPGQD